MKIDPNLAHESLLMGPYESTSHFERLLDVPGGRVPRVPPRGAQRGEMRTTFPIIGRFGDIYVRFGFLSVVSVSAFW